MGKRAGIAGPFAVMILVLLPFQESFSMCEDEDREQWTNEEALAHWDKRSRPMPEKVRLFLTSVSSLRRSWNYFAKD